MKMQYLRSLLLSASVAVLAFTFTSCKDDEPTPSNPNTGFPACRVVSGNFDGDQISLTYNANKRLTQIAGIGGQTLSYTHAGDSIVATGTLEGTAFREVAKIANNRITSSVQVAEGEEEIPGAGSVRIRFTNANNYVYNAANQLSAINTTVTVQFLLPNGQPVGPPTTETSSQVYTYTNNALTRVVATDAEGETETTDFTPSTTKLSTNNAVLLNVFDGVAESFVIAAVPTLNLGNFMPSRATQGNFIRNYTYQVDDKENITRINEAVGTETSIYTFTYNCD